MSRLKVHYDNYRTVNEGRSGRGWALCTDVIVGEATTELAWVTCRRCLSKLPVDANGSITHPT